MKTVLVTTDTVGGVFSYTLTLAHELSARGIGVHVATMGLPPRPEQRAALSAIARVTLHESEYALEWMDDPWKDVDAAGDWLRGIASTIRPDVVHLNGYAHGTLDFGAPKVVAGHSCVLSWWDAVHGEPPPDRYREYQRRVTAGLRAADLVITCSQAMRLALDQHYGPIRDVRVIHNGARRPADATATVKEPFVFSCGRAWDQAKNVAALERIASDITWPIRIAGWDVPGAPSLGWLDQETLGEWMQRASIFALPARYEPFGLSALEAALRGAALVLGDLPSQREIWGDAATYVDPNDDGALAATIQRLIDDKALRQVQMERALTRARHFSPHRMANGVVAAYAAVHRPQEVACV